MSQMSSNSSSPSSRTKQNEGMLGRATYHDPEGYERVSGGRFG